jgi:hypothetical protein
MHRKLKDLALFFQLFTLMIGVSACQKVINVNLRNVSPQIVIDGSIVNQSGPFSILITQTVNYDQDNIFPFVNGAQVNISDNAGNSENLQPSTPGSYVTSTLTGVPGRAYTLMVNAFGKNYSATSVMPNPVPIDTIIIDTTGVGGFGGGFGPAHAKSKTVKVLFHDPAGVSNYYRFVETVNNIPKTNIFIVSDNLQDGIQITRNLSRDTTILHGDSVAVQLYSIDKNVYEYYRTLNLIIQGGGGFQTSTPGNPTTNLNNNALGYFSACSVTRKAIKFN